MNTFIEVLNAAITAVLNPFLWVFSWFCWLCLAVTQLIIKAGDFSEAWCMFWFPIYDQFFNMSLDAQEFADGYSILWPWQDDLDDDIEFLEDENE